jgi:integrase
VPQFQSAIINLRREPQGRVGPRYVCERLRFRALGAGLPSMVELTDGSLITGPPKSEAGKRVLTLPSFLLPDLRRHLEEFTEEGENSLVFTGPKGAPMRRPNFSRTWRVATESARLTGIHFHDLRHAGNHFAAGTGASLAELMGRMGHSTARAALIYQHRTTERDRLLAAAISATVKAELTKAAQPSGTRRAREPQ